MPPLKLDALLPVAIAIAALALGTHAAAAQAYDHKEVSVFIASGPGGGYDRYGRLIARHIGKYLPGKPTVVPKNMPGAGGLVLANFMYSKAPQDGSAIAIMQNERVLDPILGVPNASYKSGAFAWLGGVNQLTNICVSWHTTGVTSALQLRNRELITGVSSGSSTETGAILLNELAGAKLKMVKGYPGTTEIMLAMERGEVQAMCGIGWDSYKSGRADWIKGKKANVFVQMGFALPELKGVPVLRDILVRKEDGPVADFLTDRLLIGRPFMSTPGLPAATVQILRDAFWQTMQDKELIAEAAKGDIPVEAIPGDKVQDYVHKIENTPKAVIARAKQLL